MKPTSKSRLLQLAKRCGLFAAARQLTRGGIAIIGWHGVSIDGEHDRFPQYFVSPTRLAQRLEFLQQHYQIIPLREAMRQHATRQIKPHQVVLTFDDGLSDFGRAAVPVLERFRAPATVYAVSSTMREPLACKMVVRDLLGMANEERLVAYSAAAASADEHSPSPRRSGAISHHQQRLQALAAEDREPYLLELAAELDVDFEPILRRRIWHHHTAQELRALVERGFDVQVHTHSHTTVLEAPQRVCEEAATCRRLLEEATQQPAVDYCYPSGLWEPAAWEGLRQAGMRSAVTCKQGPNFASTPALALRRYVDHQQRSQLEFEAMVSGLPWLLHLISHPQRLHTPSIARHGGRPYF